MSIIDGNDVLIFIGMIFVGYGLYLINDPIPIMVAGVVFLLIGMIGAWRKGQNK